MPGTVILPYDVAAYGNPNAALLSGISLNTVQAQFGLVAGDELTLQVYPRNRPAITGNPTTTQRIASGSSMAVYGKPQSSPGVGTFLFDTVSFAEFNTIPGDDSGDWYYAGLLDLNTDEALALFDGTSPSVAVMLIVEIIDATGKPQRYLIPITLFAPYYTGNEGTPTPATPTFLTAAQTQAEVVNNWNFITDIGGSIATSLNSQATAGVVAYGTQVGMRGISGVNAGGYTIWEYTQWTGGGTPSAGARQQPPLDFNASSNPGLWVQLL
jgi:hypothetical protein